ncbi:MAG: hypothetical protein M1824_005202 [Vezdaea acicularis]|nr:MAG: hypothetical protein M1824_005202 [Vezdaea acicularis]
MSSLADTAASITQSSSASEKSGKAKLEEVTRILDVLKADLSEKSLSVDQTRSLLERLKVHGRQIKDADPIFTNEGISTLCTYGFDYKPFDVSREALRCLANALVLNASTRQTLVDLGYATKAAERLKNDDRDDEFLVSRLLFLTTYETDVSFEVLVDEHQLADSINQNIARHSKLYSKGSRPQQKPSDLDILALSETLKLIFNITHFYPARHDVFTPSIPHILKILTRHPIPSPALTQPVNYLINALINLDLAGPQKGSSASTPLFPAFDPKCNAEHLILILDRTTIDYPPTTLDELASPILALIRQVHDLAPDDVRAHIHTLLLPSDDERKKPLGQSDTLAARLLNLSTSPMVPALRDSISALFFELSGRDADRFVANVGYGFAAGFLLSHHLPVPASARDASAEAAVTTTTPVRPPGQSVGGSMHNPITGQRLDMESPVELPEMSEEEKEREAERLFVLFERLRATGVMDVVNPVEAAVRDGRFEEVD